MPANELIHHLAAALLGSAARHGISLLPPATSARTADDRQWDGHDLVNFMRVLGTELDDAFFGLAKSRCPPSASQFGAELMVLSETLGEALDRYFRFHEIVTDGLALSLGVEGKSAYIEIVPANPLLDPDHFLTEWYTTRLHGFAQWLIGEEIPLTEVEFTHSRRLPASVYASVFGGHVAFDQPTNRFSFPGRLLRRRVVRDVKELSVLSSGAYDPEHPSLHHRTWKNLVKSSLRARLYRMATIPTMEELAKEFGVSGQTLRRGLKTEGTSYRQIKAEARREVVLSNISDTTLTLSQISVLAGFAETNGLVRAMKAWTGLSPSAFRRVAIDHPEGEGTSPIDDGRETVDL